MVPAAPSRITGIANLSPMIIGMKPAEPQHAERGAIRRSVLLAMVLLLGGCASPDLPAVYKSKSVPSAVDCTAYPEPPAPPACRNLYEDITHPPDLPPVDATRLR